jgi:hypothetical protein
MQRMQAMSHNIVHEIGMHLSGARNDSVNIKS